jgi:hypothetical protein
MPGGSPTPARNRPRGLASNSPFLHAPRCVAVLGAAALCIAAWSLAGCRRNPPAGEEAFVGDRSLTLWTRLAQVREPAATLHYGARVEILDRRNEQVQVRSASGAVGWTERRSLLDSALWRRTLELRDRARGLPVQARAITYKLTNLRIEPGRTGARIYQFRPGISLEVLERSTAELAPAPEDEPATPASEAPEVKKEPRREDWVLLRAQDQDFGELAGWVLRRFLKSEIPPELLDYSNQYRFVAWFELNRVPVGVPAVAARPAGTVVPTAPAAQAAAPPGSPQRAESAPAEKPQFLVAGIQGQEGQPCDFTLLRAYTWGTARRRYETAYVESNLCGSLPILVQAADALGGEARFAFKNRGRAGAENREYVFHQTVVRRVDSRPARSRGGRPSR